MGPSDYAFRTVNTGVDSQHLYLQTEFSSADEFETLLIRHAIDSDGVKIYLNGKHIQSLDFTRATREDLENLIEGVSSMKKGKNLLSIEVTSTSKIKIFEFELWGIEK